MLRARFDAAAGFDGSDDVWVKDVLNLGFSPIKAIDLVRLCLFAHRLQSVTGCT